MTLDQIRLVLNDKTHAEQSNREAQRSIRKAGSEARRIIRKLDTSMHSKRSGQLAETRPK